MNIRHKRIGLLGATGMVGTGFARMVEISPHKLRTFLRSEFDILSNSVDMLNLDGCDVVINLAGMTNRMMINSKTEASGDICNGVFPQMLARRCAALKIPLIHLSTDCVFSGRIGLHAENATPDATDPYGVSKIKGECPEETMVVRTSIIGPEQKNFNSLLCWFLSQKNTCDGFVNHLWNGMTNIQFAKILIQIIESDQIKNGVYHVHSDDVSKFELLNLMKVAFNKTIQINPVEDINEKDMRLRSLKPLTGLEIDIPPLCEQITELVQFADNQGRWKLISE